MCVCSTHLFWTSSSLDVYQPGSHRQEEGLSRFLIHLPSAVRALMLLARRIQPFLSLVDREVEFCAIVLHLLGIYIYFFFFREKNPMYRNSNSRPNVSEGYEVTYYEVPGEVQSID